MGSHAVFNLLQAAGLELMEQYKWPSWVICDQTIHFKSNPIMLNALRVRPKVARIGCQTPHQ